MNWILRKVEELSLFRSFQAAPTPRWIVVAVDMSIILLSCVLLLIADIFSLGNQIYTEDLPLKIALILLVYLCMEYITKSYQCIIRLSVMEDLYRVFLLVFYSTMMLTAINIVSVALFEVKPFSYWNLIFIGSLAFTFLLAVRLCIKYMYMKFSIKPGDRKRIIVLGSAINSVVIAGALKNESNGKFDPVALLSLAEGKHESKINGIYVETYNPKTVKEIFEQYNSDTLVFLSTQIDLMRSGFADVFLENNITLLLLNQVEEFNVSGGNEDAPVVSSHIKNIQIEDLLGRELIKNENPLIKSNILNQSVLITGAAGSIGSEIVRQVASFGASEIVLFDQAETPMHNMQLEMEEKFPHIIIHLFIGDVQNKTRLEQAFATFIPKFVFHAAAYKHVPMMENNPTEAILTNVMGTRNVADLAVKYKVYKFVMISTDKAVNPTNIMGATKRIAEIYVQSLFFNNLQRKDTATLTQFITTRFGNVLGSNGSVIPRFRQQIENGGPVTVTHKDIIRYFMTIKEACGLVLEAGCMGKGGEIYIFDMGNPVKIYDLACRMISLAGLKVGKDIKIIETGLRPGEKLYEELLNDKERTQATVNQKIMIAKVKRYDYNEVCEKMEHLIKCADAGDIHNLVVAMKHFVPEYISMNSKFEAIDAEIDDTLESKEEILKEVSIER